MASMRSYGLAVAAGLLIVASSEFAAGGSGCGECAPLHPLTALLGVHLGLSVGLATGQPQCRAAVPCGENSGTGPNGQGNGGNGGAPSTPISDIDLGAGVGTSTTPDPGA